MEENIRREIYRRKKEKCKSRSQEIHEHQDKRDNNTFKKRKLNTEGEYKTVIQREVEIRDRNEKGETEEEESRKRQKKNTPRKILGGVLKDMEIVKDDVDWQKERNN